MNATTLRLIACLPLLAAGCGGSPRPLALTPGGGGELNDLSVSCTVWDELSGAKALTLAIANPADRTLEEVVVVFDDTYSASLQDLWVHDGAVAGSQALGRAELLPGDELEFTFSHDASNHQRMTREDGEAMPDTLVPATITIRASQGESTWEAHASAP